MWYISDIYKKCLHKNCLLKLAFYQDLLFILLYTKIELKKEWNGLNKHRK